MSEVTTFLKSTLETMGVEALDLTPETDLEDDLGLESLMKVELATKLQKKFKLPVMDQIHGIETVGELMTLLEPS